MEDWRKVPGFNYEISLTTKEGICRNMKTGKVLSNKPNKISGYVFWNLYESGHAQHKQAAVWIALTYPELVQNEYFEGAEIDHIIPLSVGGTNHPSNLRWVTHKKNMRNHMSILQHKAAQTGKRYLNNGNSKGVVQKSLEDEYIDSYISMAEAERVTGVNKKNICSCCQGKRQTAGKKDPVTGDIISYKWEYANN